MPEYKTYVVGFFQGVVGPDGRKGRVSRTLRDLALSVCPIYTYGNVKYEIRDLRQFGNGSSFAGVFAKLRADDIPHIGVPGGAEREIELQRDEGLIEKNHFLYYREHELLVYQTNRNGSSVTQLGQYCSDILNETVAFHPIIQPDAMRRLLRPETLVKHLDLSFARPTNPSWYPRDNWGAQVVSLLRESGGGSMHVQISAEGRGANRRSLPRRVKQAVRDIMGNTNTRVARFLVEEDGHEHPIDLIADRIKGKVQVEMSGRYPVPDRMFRALREARDEQLSLLREIFGNGHQALD